jgi:ABC-type Fe3+-siderophore transport system permease subunit
VSYRLRQAVYVAACLAIACAVTAAVALLPIADPTTAQGVCIVAGAIAGLAATHLLPTPSRKDGHG